MDQYPHLSKIPKGETGWFGALTALMRYLRSPGGCPWDRRQTARQFATYLQDELREYLDAFEEGDNEEIEEEFGDCLFVLLASAVCAEEEGRFNIAAALEKTHAKMIRRHGHVFGDTDAQTPEEVVDAWERVKAVEREQKARRKREKNV